MVLYRQLHDIVSSTVSAYQGHSYERYWFTEGLLAKLFKIAPGPFPTPGDTIDAPVDRLRLNYWEGGLSAEESEQCLQVCGATSGAAPLHPKRA